MSAFATGILFACLCFAIGKRNAVEIAIYGAFTLYSAIAWYGSV